MELRYDPVLGEWVMVSGIREKRPWQPTTKCPFCPGNEETGTGWRVLVLDNKYPMLAEDPPMPRRHWFYRVEEARGKCLVVVETPIHDVDDLSDLGVEQVRLVIEKVVEEHRRYMEREWARYFIWFRNKGREIGVSLTHPHSQIYVLPFIPSKIERELSNSREYWRRNGECLFCRIIGVEERDADRIIYGNREWIAFLPFYAHWPFEVHIYPRRHLQWLHQLTREEIDGLADALVRVLCGLKHVLGKPMPYMMILHQAPLRGDYPYYHLHIEIYGAYRRSGRLKYAAGIEHGAGNFTYDSIPEENAHLLRRTLEEKCIDDQHVQAIQ